ncbi:MAG: RidA family protein [Nitrospinae bacterium]|nr:RidA family protein [Nitrospinota bacterium]
MEKKIIATPHAPKAIGPYSQAVRTGNLLYVSGQIPLDPASGEMVQGGIKEQTERVLKNITAIMEEVGGTLDNVVKTTVYLQDMAHFADMNGVYAGFFKSSPPARATVQVAALPKNALVEIDAIAVI